MLTKGVADERQQCNRMNYPLSQAQTGIFELQLFSLLFTAIYTGFSIAFHKNV